MKVSSIMTRKDFELIAKWVSDYIYTDIDGKTRVYSGAIDALAIRLSRTNSAFNEQRFIDACNQR